MGPRNLVLEKKDPDLYGKGNFTKISPGIKSKSVCKGEYNCKDVYVCAAEMGFFLQNYFGQLLVAIISSLAVYNAFLAHRIRFLLTIVQVYKLYLLTLQYL